MLSTRGEGRSGKEGRQGGVVRPGATQSEHWQEAGEQGGAEPTYQCQAVKGSTGFESSPIAA